MSSLRIALVYDAVHPFSIGGIERRNHELAKALELRGHQVTRVGWCEDVAPFPGYGRLEAVGRPRSLHDPSGRRRPSDALRFARDVSRLSIEPFDVVESASLPFLHLWPLARRCRLRGVPLLVTWYEYWGGLWDAYLRSRLAGRLARTLERRATSKGSLLCAVSDLTKGRLSAAAGRRVELLPGGITEGLLGVEPHGEPERTRVVAVGRLIPEKRIDLLIEAVARLGPRELELEIIGEGPDRGRLVGLAAEAGIAKRVRFLGRLGSEEEVQRHMASATVVCHPSAREGFGLVPLEAMALRVAVILCRSSENAALELVRHGVDGLHTDATPAALAAALEQLLDAPSARAAMGACGRDRARGYTWARIAERFEELALSVREPGER